MGTTLTREARTTYTDGAMAEDLGARLVRAGLATREQLAIALAEGAQSGGALAAGLVDAGVREDDIVNLFLADGLGPEAVLSVGAPVDLSSSTPHLPASMATAFLALPLRTSGEAVEVAMADPSDLRALRELRETLARPVQARPARVSALREALARAYPHTPTRPPAPRPLELVRRKPVLHSSPPREDNGAERPTARATVDHTVPPSPERDLTAARWGEPRVSSKPPRTILSDHEASWSDLAVPGSKGATAGALRPTLAELGGTLASLRTCHDRDAIVRLACDSAAGVARTTVFLALRKGVLRGWEGIGQVSPGALRNLWIPASSPSFFKTVIDTGQPYHGPHGTTAADKLFRAATDSRGASLVVEPVRVGDRVVALLCADAPCHGQPGLERLETLASAVGAALERLIIEAKR